MRTYSIAAKALMIALAVLFSTSLVWAGTTGKLRGKIIDSKTKQPVLGAVVQIDGTTMGAQTDPNGDYLIINVPPKVYSVTAKTVGYVSRQATSVEVTVDHTTNLDFVLDPTVLETEIVQRVVAERDLLRISETQNRRQLTAENLKNMPVTSVQEILQAQVGVVERFGELHIRGGRGNEVTYVVDGVEIKDPLGGRGAVDQAMNISGNVVEDMQIIKGGYDAEYGNANSGIVTVSTKAGSQVTTGHLEYFTDDFGTEILNKNSFNYDRMELNLSGPDDLFSNKLLPSIGINWFTDKLTYSINGSAEKTDRYVNYKQYFTSVSRRDFTERSMLGLFNLTDRMVNEYFAQLRLQWRATPQLKVSFDYKGSWDDRSLFSWAFRYTPGTAPVAKDRASTYALQLTHQLDKSTFYEISLSRFRRSYTEQPGNPNDPANGVNPGDFKLYTDWEYYLDVNKNGKYDRPEPFINVNGDTSWLWGGPFYTFGDAYIPAGYPDYYWPPPSQDWSLSLREYRGVNSTFEGSGNSSTKVDTILTDWNGNGVVDFYESEPFVDLNGDGIWNAGDYVWQDVNGNGVFDENREDNINVDIPEPYTDGDRIIGEPFTDVNHNGVFDQGIDIFVSSENPTLNQDLNYNSKYDGPPFAVWSPGLPFKDLNGNGLYDAPNLQYDYGEPFIDLNQNGKWDARDTFWDKGYDQWAVYEDRSTILWTANFTISKQFSKEHEVKSGLKVEFNDLKMGNLQYPWLPYDGVYDAGPWPDRGVFRDFYNRKPIRGAYFIQDRLEYGSMVANLGLRYDFFIQSADLKQGRINDVAEGKSIQGSKNKFSPRIGFSYPISDKAKVYFNYGHFYQLPEFEYMYRRATQASNAFGIIGNENLDFLKVIQYEFGVRYELSNDYTLDFSGYYKDQFGLLNSIRRSYGAYSRNEYENSDYGRTRGLELQLDKKYGNYVQGYTSYEYSFAYGKSSSERSNYYDDYYNRTIPISEHPLDWDVRHQVTLNLDLHVPKGDHPRLFGLKLPDDLGANVLWQFGSGFPFTPDKDYPGISLLPGEQPQANSLRYPSTSKVDIRAYKRFPFVGLKFTLDLWINNLFDNQNIEAIYGLTGRHDTNTKLPGANYVLEGKDFDRNPLNLGPGRNIRVGLGVDF